MLSNCVPLISCVYHVVALFSRRRSLEVLTEAGNSQPGS